MLWDNVYSLSYWEGLKNVIRSTGSEPDEKERVLLAKEAKERADDAVIAYTTMTVMEGK